VIFFRYFIPLSPPGLAAAALFLRPSFMPLRVCARSLALLLVDGDYIYKEMEVRCMYARLPFFRISLSSSIQDARRLCARERARVFCPSEEK